MQRRATLIGVFGMAAGLWAGCFSSSSNRPGPDASTASDDGGPASDGGTPGLDATAATDAPGDSTPPDSTTPSVDATPDSSPVDSTLPDASDAGMEASTDSSADAGAGTVTSTAGLQLGTTRQNHSSTLLANGHVLICGGWYGFTGSSASCDDFNPATNTISPGPSLVIGRRDHSATLLPSGQLLVAGGSGTNDAGSFNVMRTAEIYDPIAGTFTLVSNPMAQARSGPAVLLTSGPNAGKVVLVGGYGDGTIDSGTPNDTSLDSAELFEPGASATQGTFTLLGAHLSVRRGGSMTAAGLPEGGLLAAGGSYGPGGGPYTYLDTAETLDPALTAFTATVNTMSAQRQGAQSVTLPDGRIFVFDGTGSTGYSAKADVYDPATRTFTATAALAGARNYAAIAVLKSGRVMIAGGGTSSGTMGDVIVYDPATNTFLTATGTLNPPRSLATATTLNDGRVIIAGGQTSGGFVTTAVDLFTE